MSRKRLYNRVFWTYDGKNDREAILVSLWREQTVVAGGRKMNVISFGCGARPMLLISGLNLRDVRGAGAALGLWMLYRGFGKDHTVWCFDRREDLPERYSLAEIADDLAAGMDALGLRDADVLGVSQGGMIAQYLAVRRGDLVRRLVLGVTLCRPNETITGNINAWCELARRGEMRKVAEDYMRRNYSAAYLKKTGWMLPLLIRTMKIMPARRFRTLAETCLDCGVYHDLGKIACPVLVLGGAHDAVVTAEGSREIAERLGCELFIYDDGGHSVYEEQAKDFNRRVNEFFSRA